MGHTPDQPYYCLYVPMVGVTKIPNDVGTLRVKRRIEES
jgi:hypothetical protein